jgi:hypothetical protein
MGKWSEELKEKSRGQMFAGAVVKNEAHDFGIVMALAPKVVIHGTQEGSFMPLPSDEVIATFDNVNQMVDAGWVLD